MNRDDCVVVDMVRWMRVTSFLGHVLPINAYQQDDALELGMASQTVRTSPGVLGHLDHNLMTRILKQHHIGLLLLAHSGGGH